MGPEPVGPCALCDAPLSLDEAVECKACGALLHSGCATGWCPTSDCPSRRGSAPGAGARKLLLKLALKLLLAPLLAFGIVALVTGPEQGALLAGVDGPRLVAEARALLAARPPTDRALTPRELAPAPYLGLVGRGGVSVHDDLAVVRLGAAPESAVVLVVALDAGGDLRALTEADVAACVSAPAPGWVERRDTFAAGAWVRVLAPR